MKVKNKKLNTLKEYETNADDRYKNSKILQAHES